MASADDRRCDARAGAWWVGGESGEKEASGGADFEDGERSGVDGGDGLDTAGAEETARKERVYRPDRAGVNAVTETQGRGGIMKRRKSLQ